MSTNTTPPPDAAVREAVADIQRMLPKVKDSDGPWWQAFAEQAEVLLRAVQAPRMTKEQRGVLKGTVGIMETCGMHGPIPAIRAAFPEVFAGEVSRGE